MKVSSIKDGYHFEGSGEYLKQFVSLHEIYYSSDEELKNEAVATIKTFLKKPEFFSVFTERSFPGAEDDLAGSIRTFLETGRPVRLNLSDQILCLLILFAVYGYDLRPGLKHVGALTIHFNPRFDHWQNSWNLDLRSMNLSEADSWNLWRRIRDLLDYVYEYMNELQPDREIIMYGASVTESDILEVNLGWQS